jgi:hypothetical protein
MRSSDPFGPPGTARWRVFISYTSELRKYPSGMSYVSAVEQAISAAGHVIVDMADFPAADQPAAEVCIDRVLGCDVYVGVLGTRYGSPVPDRPEVSYTELEFNTATEAGKDRLVFMLDTNASDVGIPASELIDHPFGARQDAFRRRVQESGLLTVSFGSPAELGAQVERSLMALASTRARIASGIHRDQVPTVGASGVPAGDSAGPAEETIFDFSTDAPGLADDVKASDDRLGIEDDVRTLCRLMLARSTKPPLAIGLFGDWGTGKSFFMRRMQSRIREMQREVATSLGRGGISPYCDNVVQIPFNAWHYVDSNLWASLMTRIFEGLTPATSDAARDYLFRQLDSTRVRLEQAQRDAVDASRQLGTIQTERDKLQQAQSALRGEGGKPVSSLLHLLASPGLPGDEQPPRPPQGVTTLLELRQAAQDARSTARLLQRLLGWWPFRVLLVTAVLVVLGGLGVMAAGGGDLVIRALSVAAVVVPTAATTAGIAWHRFRDVVRITSQADEVERWIENQLTAIEQRQRSLTHDRQRAEERADGAKRTIDSVRAGNLIRQYVEERVTNDAYRDQLGIISLVREDLRRLSELLCPTDDGPEVLSMTARFDIQRVVLYIDDLDRCPPARVVEVLQAVHLLLAFPLFVAVIGVDSRWLITSLEIHYQRLLQGEKGGVQEPRLEMNEWEATPADYLEKIFQIPLSLRPMGDDGYRSLMKSLLPVRVSEIGDTLDSPSEPGAAQESAEVVADHGEQPLGAQLRAREVRSFSLEGNPLAARFVIGGRRLVIVSDAGIWIWNLGTPTASPQVSAQIREVIFNVDGEQLVYKTDKEWTTVDLDTGAKAIYRLPDDIVAMAVGQQPGEIVYTAGYQISWRCGDQMQSQSWTEAPIKKLLIWGNTLLVRVASGLFVLGLPELSHPQAFTTDIGSGPVIDMALDHRNGTLYTLHKDRVCIWIWSGGSWTSMRDVVPLTGVTSLGPEARLVASHAGVLVRHVGGLLHVTSQEPSLTDVSILATPDGDMAELFADPSIPGIVLWSSPTVIVARQDNADPVEIARFSTEPINTAALSPNGRLVASVGGGSCRLWHLGSTFEDEDVSQLELTQEEAAFMATLGPIVPTARAAKRLVNVYRMLRASRIGREKLQDPDNGEYKIALLLLGLVTGWPHLALLVLRELDNATSGTWADLLDAIQNEPPTSDRFAFARGPGRGDENLEILRALHKLSKEAPAELDRYRAWSPHIRRFSMLTASQRPETR